MTGPGERYLLRQMLAATGTASLFLTGTTPIRQDPMNRTLASADTAHYYQWPAQLSTLPLQPTASVPVVPDPGRAACPPGSRPGTGRAGPQRAQLIDARTVPKPYRKDQ